MTSPSASSTFAVIPPAASRCCTTIPKGRRTCSPATVSSLGALARRRPETFPQLIDDVEHRIFDRLPDETWFYPGHGNDSTLGAERPHLTEWRDRRLVTQGSQPTRSQTTIVLRSWLYTCAIR